jgi:hypothetical protein
MLQASLHFHTLKVKVQYWVNIGLFYYGKSENA